MLSRSSTPPLPDTASTEPSPATTTALESFGRYYDDVLLPIWLGLGQDAQANLCYEALIVNNDTLVPAFTTRYRTMACARQLYAFARVTQLSRRHRDLYAERTAALYHMLDARFRDTIHGSWLFATDDTLAPHDITKGLYTHAFVLFAVAHWLAMSDNPHTTALTHDTHDVITCSFARAGVKPLPVASMDARFSTMLAGVAQSPVMHLTETYLAVAALDEPLAWAETGVRTLAEGILARFIDTRTSSIAELPIDKTSTDNHIEPDHQFEWFYPVRAHADVSTRSEAGLHLTESLTRVVDVACTDGVDADTQGVCLSLNLDGTIHSASQRIWAQTEYGRALTLCTETQDAMLTRLLSVWSARFLHTQG